jgi:hypothetical protein
MRLPSDLAKRDLSPDQNRSTPENWKRVCRQSAKSDLGMLQEATAVILGPKLGACIASASATP